MLEKRRLLAAAALWTGLACRECSSFRPPTPTQRATSSRASRSTVHLLSAHGEGGRADPIGSRREWAASAFSTLMTTAALSSIAPPASAAESRDIVWKTGKAPIVPGQKLKDKSDVKGTKKDPSFLRSVSDCKGQCENSRGADGLSRSSVECLAACQDVCCTTYEQCTFAIVPR
ncbi:hypothetical protein ACHAXT_007447 [Thalassiosira profunda]